MDLKDNLFAELVNKKLLIDGSVNKQLIIAGLRLGQYI